MAAWLQADSADEQQAHIQAARAAASGQHINRLNVHSCVTAPMSSLPPVQQALEMYLPIVGWVVEKLFVVNRCISAVFPTFDSPTSNT